MTFLPVGDGVALGSAAVRSTGTDRPRQQPQAPVSRRALEARRQLRRARSRGRALAPGARRGVQGGDDPVRADAALRLPRPGAPRQARGDRACAGCSTASATPIPTDARLRDELQLPDTEDQLIRIEPGFPRPMRICRLDAFLQGYDVKFLEFNADSPAGVGYTDILYEGLRTTIDLERVRQEFDTAYTQILPELIAHAARRLRARPRHPHRPARRARGSRSSTPPARPASPSSASSAPPPRRPASRPTTPRSTRSPTTAPRCKVKDEPVHLVYRRALLEDLDQSDLVAAARDGRICLVNPFRSRVANNKKLFALFQDPRFTYLVEGDEADVIRATIPWTRILRPGPRHLRRLDDRPAVVRRRQPREAGAQARLGLRRPRRLARDGDAAGRVGADHRRRTPTARTTSCRSTSRYRRRCSRRSRTGTSRCA